MTRHQNPGRELLLRIFRPDAVSGWRFPAACAIMNGMITVDSSLLVAHGDSCGSRERLSLPRVRSETGVHR